MDAIDVICICLLPFTLPMYGGIKAYTHIRKRIEHRRINKFVSKCVDSMKHVLYVYSEPSYDPLVCVWEKTDENNTRQLYAMVHYMNGFYDSYCDTLLTINRVIYTWWKHDTDVHIILTTCKKDSCTLKDLELFEEYKATHSQQIGSRKDSSDQPLNKLYIVSRAAAYDGYNKGLWFIHSRWPAWNPLHTLNKKELDDILYVLPYHIDNGVVKPVVKFIEDTLFVQS